MESVCVTAMPLIPSAAPLILALPAPPPPAACCAPGGVPEALSAARASPALPFAASPVSRFHCFMLPPPQCFSATAHGWCEKANDRALPLSTCNLATRPAVRPTLLSAADSYSGGGGRPRGRRQLHRDNLMTSKEVRFAFD
ncbi:unnamed protein product [Closterium sp. Yama58-4]|nr:unnamed protein product [Closterium sp. Yama58-4]